ncbi:hypothetical protein niasHT_027792 [Heterodera trifolii]|uniref:BTB domain-containing protein n=1 Tax=Heterodera trifolii TaxID=157864 RepID=A0ABD2JFX9_9BILA
MFRFDEKNSNFGGVENPVEVPDVEAAAFKVMLRFIYTDGLSGLNGDNAMAVLYAARKYGIDALADPCLQFPISTQQNAGERFSGIWCGQQRAQIGPLVWTETRNCSNRRSNAPNCMAKRRMERGRDCSVYFPDDPWFVNALIAAHKAVLIPASEVFEAMFRFDEKNSNFGGVENPVEVPDVEAAAFKVMLRFIYTDGLSGLNGDNAMAVLYAARKYGIDALADPCLQFPISTLRNVFLAYALATLLQLEDFAHKCLAYIDKNADSLIRSDDFLQVDQKTLCEILERDQLQICGEISIWKAALRWADCQCLQNGHECSAENRRAALGPALFQIRFPLFQPTKFSEIIVPSGILTMEEELGIYQFYCHPNFQGLFQLQFPCHGRASDRHHVTFVLDIEKFSEFAREIVGSERSSEAAFVGGMPWKIRATIKMAKQGTGKCLDLYLWCCATSVEEGDENWSRKCSAIFRIVGQGNGTEDFARKFDGQICNSEICNLGWSEFVTLSKLMDSSKGLYDQKADKVALAIDVTVK